MPIHITVVITRMEFGNLVIGNLQFAISNWQHVIGYWYLALSNYELAAVNRKKAI